MTTSAIDLEQAARTSAFRCERPSDPCAIVIFGASGDLAKRKLIPALHDLAAQACLAPRFVIVGYARTPLGDDQFRSICTEALYKTPAAVAADPVWPAFSGALHYVSGEYDNPDAYKKLSARLDELDRAQNLAGNRLFYLSTPPEVYPRVVEQLGRAGLARPRDARSWVRIIIEKPFGHDAESAGKLNERVLDVFNEHQVYRIDHYLGKETVQNLLVFRFGNGIFEPIWNRNYVNHVQITAAESLGVERRAAFYESAGALRDMIQSHMLQLTSLVAVEPPAAFDATAVRNEKIKVLQSIRPFTPEMVKSWVVRGQYGPGSIDGNDVAGYREEPGVDPNSRTETFVAMKLVVDNWRWAGVPFYLRTGKRLPSRTTEIAIQFRQAPHVVFRGRNVQSNCLIMNIQPDEGISLTFGAKTPGQAMDIRSVKMDFLYRTTFNVGSQNAYATLINDCMRGDATLFDRADSVEAAWSLVDPILTAWRQSAPKFPNYAAGAWGPPEADALVETDGRAWRKL